jgi:hypothetical protein
MNLIEMAQGMDEFCEHGNGPSSSLENRIFLDRTRNHQVFRALFSAFYLFIYFAQSNQLLRI